MAPQSCPSMLLLTKRVKFIFVERVILDSQDPFALDQRRPLCGHLIFRITRVLCDSYAHSVNVGILVLMCDDPFRVA